MQLSVDKKIERFLRNWQNEVDSAAQYRELARQESNANISKIYAALGKVEEKHVLFWEEHLTQSGVTNLVRKPSWRSLVLIWLARRVGPGLILPTIRDSETATQNTYVGQREVRGTTLVADERQHAQILAKIDKTSPTGVEGSFIGKIEGRHRNVGGNALRAGVLGVNDGLCSNLSLVMGVIGLSTGSKTVLLTGLAGLCAGACSMALGEWISVKSSRELAENEIQIESDELDADPESEREELKLIYESKGLSQNEARELSEKMMSDPKKALDTLTREELGIDPDQLGGSPIEAAAFSFVLFAVGAIIPILPLFFTSGTKATWLSIALSAAALFGFGAFTTVFTGQSVMKTGSRQVVLGLGAAAITFGLGHLLHVSIA